MRPIYLLLLALGLTANGYAQGTFALRNYDSIYGVNAPIFNADGTPLYGENLLAELYGGASADSLQEGRQQFTGEPLRVPLTHVIPDGSRGYFRSPYYAYFPEVPNGAVAWLQVRAWDASLGTTYEEVVARNIGGYGSSALFRVVAGGVGTPPTPPAPLTGLQSFSLSPIVPEPSTWSFVLIGLSAIWTAARRARDSWQR